MSIKVSYPSEVKTTYCSISRECGPRMTGTTRDMGSTVEINQETATHRRARILAEHNVIVADVAMEDMPEFVQTIMGCERSE